MINNDEPSSPERTISRGSAALQRWGGSGCVCTRVRVCACVCVGGSGRAPRAAGQRARLCPPQAPASAERAAAGRTARPAGSSPSAEFRQSPRSARSRARPAARCPGSPASLTGARPPQPRGKPRTLPGAAVRWPGSANLCAAAPVTARTSCDAARAGKNLHPLRLWSKRDGAGVLLGRRIAQLAPSPHAKFLFSEGYLPAFVLSQLQCSPEKKGKLLEGGRRGLVTITPGLPPLL